MTVTMPQGVRLRERASPHCDGCRVNPHGYVPQVFFPSVAGRLRAVGDATADALGDHVMNPDLLMPGDRYRDAAVLVPLVAREAEVTAILTERTAHLASHAGQVAFPGGKIDPGDADAVAAALREAEEEIGLAREAVTVLGALDPYLSRTGYRIVPVVGRVDPAYSLTVNPNEVADVFEVPLSFLLDAGNLTRATRVFAGRERYFYEMHFGSHYIWGVTAGIIHALSEQVR